MRDRDDLAKVLPEMVRAGRGHAWLKFERMAVYVRVGPRVIEGGRQFLQCAQLANLSLSPRFQRRGTFTRLVKTVQDLTHLPIYVEQVLNEEFLASLLRRGFKPARTWERRVCDVYLPKEPDKTCSPLR